MDRFTEEERKKMPLYPLGFVAELIGITRQTLRLYEKHGLLKPARRNKNRFYSENGIKWLRCLRDLIHTKKSSIEGIKKLLDYAPYWELIKCSEESKDRCSAYIDRTKPCWELSKTICQGATVKVCEDCVVFLSRAVKRKAI